MAWKIEYRGHTLAESEVTAAHLSMVAALTGEDTWDNLDPMRSPSILTAWCIVTAAPSADGDLNALALFVAGQPMADLVAAVTTVEDPPTLRAVDDIKAG